MSKKNFSLSRREFLASAGALTAGMFFSIRKLSAVPIEPVRARVAVEKANQYNYNYLRTRIADMVDKLGGFNDIIRPGDKVGIKINLTGGTVAAEKSITQFGGYHATETFWSNPVVARIVGELCKDSGAGEVYFMEASYDKMESFRYGGFDKIANYVGGTIIDLNYTHPFSDWKTGFIDSYYRWPDWPLNGLLYDIDCFISLPKMKQHAIAGVTNAMKNLIGITPLGVQKYSKGAGNRKGLHRDDNNQGCPDCLVKAIVDLNTVRPVNFAIVDGIYTETGSEGTWGGGFTPIQPGILVAGKNPVAVDSVCTAAMGFDPETSDYKQPFGRALNYLRLADVERGLGPHRLSEIEIVGKAIEEVRYFWELPENLEKLIEKYGPDILEPYAGTIK